ncbi:MAG: SUMF1/EgtB/PvdO family nonheme iron enzyme [Polyangiaceae bacterium]|nr:SUMF1/EgtB/PvdO family nonheme iron enzyme [Polyangiaceae bacterium]
MRPRTLPRAAAGLLAAALSSACAGAPPAPPSGVAPPAPPPSAAPPAPPAPAAGPAAAAPAEGAPGLAEPPPAGSAPPAGPGPAAGPLSSPAGYVPSSDLDDAACPSGMQLVEGDYCTDVEQTCLRSWYDKSNKKTVCEAFAPPTRCVGARVKKRYCIDTYEWPNQRGVRPEVMNTFYQAQTKCAAVGKRMCTESEWTLACEGPEMKPFPHGYERDAAKCNGDHDWDHPNMKKVAQRDPKELARLWRGVPSGSQPWCVSDYGVADLPANADEVVASETYGGGFRGKYDSVHSGGPWYRGVRNQCRPKIYTHDEGFYYYFLSFRCCAEPDGAAVDPRTPKQRKAEWRFDRVERLAGWTLVDLRERLRLKAEGRCECRERDVRCKTMCGLLLGPGAVDGR